MTGYVAHHEIAKIVVGAPSSWVAHSSSNRSAGQAWERQFKIKSVTKLLDLGLRLRFKLESLQSLWSAQ